MQKVSFTKPTQLRGIKKFQLYLIIRRRFSAKEIKKVYHSKGKKHRKQFVALSRWVRKVILKYNTFEDSQINFNLTYQAILSNVLQNIEKQLWDSGIDNGNKEFSFDETRHINYLAKVSRKLKRIEL